MYNIQCGCGTDVCMYETCDLFNICKRESSSYQWKMRVYNGRSDFRLRNTKRDTTNAFVRRVALRICCTHCPSCGSLLALLSYKLSGDTVLCCGTGRATDRCRLLGRRIVGLPCFDCERSSPFQTSWLCGSGTFW